MIKKKEIIGLVLSGCIRMGTLFAIKDSLEGDTIVRSNPPSDLDGHLAVEVKRLYPDISRLKKEIEAEALSDNANPGTTVGPSSGFESMDLHMEEILPDMTEEDCKMLIKTLEMGLPGTSNEKADVEQLEASTIGQPSTGGIVNEEFSCESIRNSIIGYLKSVVNQAFLLGFKVYLKLDQFLSSFGNKNMK